MTGRLVENTADDQLHHAFGQTIGELVVHEPFRLECVEQPLLGQLSSWLATVVRGQLFRRRRHLGRNLSGRTLAGTVASAPRSGFSGQLRGSLARAEPPWGGG
jgi:hypothetical protein